MSNTFGTRFQVTTFGESHSMGLGAVVDGCPARIALDEADIQKQLDRRKPGQSSLTTQRKEEDKVHILSGTEEGLTLGSPVALVFYNTDIRPGDYRAMRDIPRPSHGDYTYQVKYGIRTRSGGGRASARETVARVAAGAVAEAFLKARYSVKIVAWVSQVADIQSGPPDMNTIERHDVDRRMVRCPDFGSAAKMEDAISGARDRGDSLGGIITCVCRNVPAGWGEPVFDKLEACLARAMLSIPATKGFDIGSGFESASMEGSRHNDPFVWKNGRLGTSTNYSGGVQAGISNGEPIYFRVAFKPTATISMPQKTADLYGNEAVLEGKGRHDPCVLPRAVPVVEAMAALTLADMALLHESGKNGMGI